MSLHARTWFASLRTLIFRFAVPVFALGSICDQILSHNHSAMLELVPDGDFSYLSSESQNDKELIRLEFLDGQHFSQPSDSAWAGQAMEKCQIVFSPWAMGQT
jgi:hypothetical protein